MAGQISAFDDTEYISNSNSIVRYSLTASRTVDRREDAPRSLEDIINETLADPNPLPPPSFELVLIFASPLLVLAAFVVAVIILRKKRRSHRLRPPKTSNRYVK